MGHRDAVVETVLAVARRSYEQHIQYPAAALAYYGFVSLVPLLVILVAVVGAQVTRPIRTAAFRFLTPEAQRLVVEALTNSSGKVGAILFATLVLVWSGANITAGFQTVVKRVERPSDRSLPGRCATRSVSSGRSAWGSEPSSSRTCSSPCCPALRTP